MGPVESAPKLLDGHIGVKSCVLGDELDSIALTVVASDELLGGYAVDVAPEGAVDLGEDVALRSHEAIIIRRRMRVNTCA